MIDTLVGLRDYPLGEKRPELIKTLSGKSLKDVTMQAVIEGSVNEQDIRIAPQTLLLQAKIAELVGRVPLAQNFRRAAELCAVPDAKVLEIYNSLRPYRRSFEELEQIAIDLERNYNAVLNATLIREAALAYRQSGFLKR